MNSFNKLFPKNGLRWLSTNIKESIQGTNVGQRGWRLFLFAAFVYGAVTNIPACYQDYKLKKLQVEVDSYKKNQPKENSNQ